MENADTTAMRLCVFLNLCVVETLMLHIQVHVCFTYRLHVSMLAAHGSSWDHTHSCAPGARRESCVACRPVRLERVYTPRLHLVGGVGGGEANSRKLFRSLWELLLIQRYNNHWLNLFVFAGFLLTP